MILYINSHVSPCMFRLISNCKVLLPAMIVSNPYASGHNTSVS